MVLCVLSQSKRKMPLESKKKLVSKKPKILKSKAKQVKNLSELCFCFEDLHVFRI